MTTGHPRPRLRHILGWTSVALSTLFAGLWAFWGAIENFHEGWYSHSRLTNLGMMVAQYMLPMLLFVGGAVIAIRWPLFGSVVYVAGAAGAAWHFRGAPPLVLYPFIARPLVLMAIGYGLGRPEPRRRAMVVVLGLPLATFLIAGAWPASRVIGRLDDGDRSARRVTGNGVDLISAPGGPGWPHHGVPWAEAAHLPPSQRRGHRGLGHAARHLAPADGRGGGALDALPRSEQRGRVGSGQGARELPLHA